MAEQAKYDARELAVLCRISLRQLRRDVRRCLGSSPQAWLNERRLMAARELLLSGQSVKEVAFNLGFRQASHFCRQFKLRNGMTPSEFVQRRKPPRPLETLAAADNRWPRRASECV